MIREHDCVVLTEGFPIDGIAPGDIGTVVHVHAAGKAFEVEVTTPAGDTLGVATVLASQLRPMTASDMRECRTA